jgi:predicted nucleotidyltransferase
MIMVPQITKPRIEIPKEAIAEFCKRNYITKLSLFGSVLRDDFTPKSDVDFLVEFQPKHVPGLIRLIGMEMELSKVLSGHKAHICTAGDLSKYFRKKVVAEAQLQYVTA